MRKHKGTPSRRDKHVTLPAISPPGVTRGRFVGGHRSGLAGCKPPPPFLHHGLFLFVTAATPAGTMGRLSTTECTYLPTYLPRARGHETRGRWDRLMRRIRREWVAQWWITKKAKRRGGGERCKRRCWTGEKGKR